MPGLAEPNIAFLQPVYDSAEVRFRERAASSGAVPYALLLVFTVLLYSQLPRLIPELETYRIVYIVGALAIIWLGFERISARRGLDFVWPESPLLLALLAAAVLSCFGALWMRYAVQNTLDLAKMVAFYFLIVNSVINWKQLRRLIWVVVLGGLFPAVGTLVNYAQGNLRDGRAGWIGIFANPNELAYSLVILIPLAAYLAANARSWRIPLLWLIVAAYIAATFFSFSRGGMLGLLRILGLLGLRSKRASAQALVLALIAASLIFILRGWSRSEGFAKLGDDADVQSRIVTMWGGLQMFAEHPLTGVGLGCSTIAWPLYAPSGLHDKWLVIHNTFVQALGEMGLPGLAFFTMLLAAAVYDCRRMSRGKALLGSAARARGWPQLATSLETSLWGFIVCGMAGGFVITWFPYLLVALISSLKKLKEGEASAALA